MKLISTNYTTGAFNIGTLILRVGLATLMIPHGYDKLVHFAAYSKQFVNFLGTGQSVSLGLDIFAELLCAGLVLMGLFTRLAAIPLIIAMAVAVWKGHNGDIFGAGEHAMLFFVGFLTVLILGPGKISVAGALGK
jgi:putative oxidoreductase